VARNDAGLPDFYALHFHSRYHDLCVWVFDLLHHNGRDLREVPLFERKASLEKLILARHDALCRFRAGRGRHLEETTSVDYAFVERYRVPNEPMPGRLARTRRRLA
jgi:ATP-dependent DNA ligase